MIGGPVSNVILIVIISTQQVCPATVAGQQRLWQARHFIFHRVVKEAPSVFGCGRARVVERNRRRGHRRDRGVLFCGSFYYVFLAKSFLRSVRPVSLT